MSEYKTGTVNVTNGSAVVVGVGTEFLTNVDEGDIFTKVDSGVTYTVGSVTDDTHLVLTGNYAGATESGISYTISTGFTSPDHIAYPEPGDTQPTATVKRAILKIQALFTSLISGTALAAATIYESTADGLAGTTNGDLFWVASSLSFTLYRNDAGSATEISEALNLLALSDHNAEVTAHGQTTVGRALVTAVNAAAARTAINAPSVDDIGLKETGTLAFSAATDADFRADYQSITFTDAFADADYRLLFEVESGDPEFIGEIVPYDRTDAGCKVRLTGSGDGTIRWTAFGILA